MYERYIKRLLDIILSALALVMLSPVMLVVSLLVRFKLGSPVVFKQVRPGKDRQLFVMYKFRTMTNACDSSGALLSDEERLTSFGKLLRSSSLDELPELWNILKGDMSIVGPRPQLVRDMLFFSEDEMRRQEVKPGLTGLAQVNGRNGLSWPNKLKYDLEYISDISFLGDVNIIFMTVGSVFRREGISSEGHATAEDLGDYLLMRGEVSRERYDELQEEAKSLLAEFRS